MASNDPTKVLAGRPNVEGAVFHAPLGTVAPVDAKTALAVDFVGLGYISEDGLTNSYTRDSEQVREWGGKIVRVLQTDVTDTFSLAFIQGGSPDVLKAIFGEANVTVVPGDGTTTGELITVKRSGEPLPSGVWVFEMFDAGKHRRIVLENAQITENEDIAYQRGAVVQYGVTITAYPGPDGASSTEFIEEKLAA